MLHASAPLSTALERLPGLAAALLDDHPMAAGDVLIIASNSGGNAVTTELAPLARDAGVRTIGHHQPAPRHVVRRRASRGGPRLHELVEVAIDNGGVVGDAAVDIDGLAEPGGPTSTVVGAAIVNALVAEVVERLVARGIVPEVYVSSNVAGGDAANDRFQRRRRRDDRRRRPPPRSPSGASSRATTADPGPTTQRLDLIGFLADRGMNTFVYGPKDDPLVRRDWRVPYDGDALARLRRAGRALPARTACASCTASRPASSSATRDDADLGRSAGQAAERRRPGRRRLRACCSTTSRASSSTPRTGRPSPTSRDGPRRTSANRVFARLGRGPRPHRSARRSTGARAPSPTSSALGAGHRPAHRPVLDRPGHLLRRRSTSPTPRRSRARRTGRRTYWDNYPVNDVAMGYELHIGPYRGRDPQLWRVRRRASSPTAWSCSRRRSIPFATIADYLRDPEGYDPEASWQRAHPRCRGRGGRWRRSRCSPTTCARRACAADDAPIVGRALEAFLFRLDQGDAAPRPPRTWARSRTGCSPPPPTCSGARS